jgi:hypothetical protein
MKISNIPERVINLKAGHSLDSLQGRGKLYQLPSGAWQQGWDAAIRFVKRAENAAAICEHCGKFIETYNGIFIDHDGHYFCEKCYRQQEHFGTARAK